MLRKQTSDRDPAICGKQSVWKICWPISMIIHEYQPVAGHFILEFQDRRERIHSPSSLLSLSLSLVFRVIPKRLRDSLAKSTRDGIVGDIR